MRDVRLVKQSKTRMDDETYFVMVWAAEVEMNCVSKEKRSEAHLGQCETYSELIWIAVGALI